MISIIVVNYRVPELLEKCLESIITADPNIRNEIIVVDNASNDHSRDIIRDKYPQIKWIQNLKNVGFSKAVNIGIKHSSGEMILLLNPDAQLGSGALGALESFFQTHPEVGIAGGKILNADGSFQRQCRRKFPTPGSAFFRLFGLSSLFPKHRLAAQYELLEDDIDSIQEVDAVSGSMLCFPRMLLDKVGYFDEGFFLFGEDLDFCYRVKRAGYRVFYVPEAQIVHIRGASRRKRKWQTIWHTHYAMHRFYRKHSASQSIALFDILIYTVIWIRCIGLLLIEPFISEFHRGRHVD